MTEDAAPDETEIRRSLPLWRRIAGWTGVTVAGLVLLVLAAVLGLDTQPGRRFVADQVAGYRMANGLNFRIGRIDGSLYGAMVLRDVQVRDAKGAFATSPEIDVDWRPLAVLRNHVDLRSLETALIRLDRLPVLKPVPSEPNAPLLPDIDIDVNRLRVGRLEIGQAVTGNRHVARIAGAIHIADRRAQIEAEGETIAAPGIAGGDRLALRLDAVPDQDKLDLDVRLRAPPGGLVAGLAGLKAPLAFSIEGKGSWKSWQGRALGRLGGGELANLALQAHDGAIRVRGVTRPGLYLQGPVERLTAPVLRVALDATLEQRRADTRLALRSDALAVTANGRLDLGTGRFGDFRTEAMLLTPGVIAPDLNGRSVRLAIALDGPFARPMVEYQLSAVALGFGETVVERLHAEGRARVDADRILVPIHAKAARVTGLNAAAGGLLTNVAVDGDFALNGDKLLTDNLRIRSDRIDAMAIVAADIGTGKYAAGLKGRVNDYRIDGVGIVNVTTDANLYAAPGGGYGIRGRIAGRTAEIFNQGARDFLGGNAVAHVDLGWSPKGVISFSGLRLNAPRFRITGGSGSYDPAGPIRIDADAYSTQYGPIRARAEGTMARPVLLVRAPRPGLGVGIVDLEARVRGDNGAYAVLAKGGSDYGPFSADTLVHAGGALAVDVRQARFAGVGFQGRIEQLRAGPFGGQLAFAGSGVTGTLRLGAEGRYQRADVDARAYRAQIPGVAGLTIGRALLTGNAVLYPGRPAITGDAQIANLRQGDFVLTEARARIRYQDGHGTAQALATGSSGVPFRLAANARLSPSEYLVALQGQANGIAFRTGAPARIAIAHGTYRLTPTKLDFDRGAVRLAGSYGDGIALQARLDRLDLSIVNAFVPGLGIGGAATGSVDFAEPGPGAFPRAEARMDIAGLTRTTLSTESTPVDVTLAGRLLPDGGELRALAKQGSATIGRLVAAMRPLGPGAGSWTERLFAAPLSGGVRYNGPSGVLFSLGGLSGQTLSGPIGVAADFSGHLRQPQLNGVVRADNLGYENETYGTRLTAMKIDGRFTNDQFVLNQLQAKAGDGSVTAQGTIGLAADSGFPIDIRVKLDNARLARSDDMSGTATGELRVTHGRDGGLIQGRFDIADARYQIIRQGSAEVPELTGVRRKSDLARAAAANAANAGGTGQSDALAAAGFRLDLRITASNRVFVTGMGLESEWLANIRVSGTPADPRVTGQAKVVRGTYSFAGKRFELTRGVIRFEGGALSDPLLDIVANTTAEGVTATLNIAGTAQRPEVTFTSTPALPQDEVLSRLLFGSSVTNLSATEAIQLAAALNSLRGTGGGLNPLGKLRSAGGIDRLRILAADDTTGRGTALAAGKYITDDIYVEIVTDARGFTATQLEIALSKALSLLSQTGSFGGSSVSLRYSKDY